MNPFSLQVLVVTTTLPHQTAVRAFVDASGYRLRELGDQLVQDKPAEALHVEYMVVPAEGIQ
jgi:hypothetical protein